MKVISLWKSWNTMKVILSRYVKNFFVLVIKWKTCPFYFDIFQFEFEILSHWYMSFKHEIHEISAHALCSCTYLNKEMPTSVGTAMFDYREQINVDVWTEKVTFPTILSLQACNKMHMTLCVMWDMFSQHSAQIQASPSDSSWIQILVPRKTHLTL